MSASKHPEAHDNGAGRSRPWWMPGEPNLPRRSSVTDVDDAERARAQADAMRDGSYEDHPLDCRCRPCIRDEVADAGR